MWKCLQFAISCDAFRQAWRSYALNIGDCIVYLYRIYFNVGHRRHLLCLWVPHVLAVHLRIGKEEECIRCTMANVQQTNVTSSTSTSAASTALCA